MGRCATTAEIARDAGLTKPVAAAIEQAFVTAGLAKRADYGLVEFTPGVGRPPGPAASGRGG